MVVVVVVEEGVGAGVQRLTVDGKGWKRQSDTRSHSGRVMIKEDITLAFLCRSVSPPGLFVERTARRVWGGSASRLRHSTLINR